MHSQIDVLIATLNGEKFFHSLIESILKQTIPVNILIRDDGSEDDTLTIINGYLQRYPERIRLISHDRAEHGAAKNFSKLLIASNAQYVMLADQDDVWDTDKAAICLTEMQRLEDKNGRLSPALVHSDLRVVDHDLNLIAPSFFDFQGLHGERLGLSDLLAQNVVTGCTAMLNKALSCLVSPVPREAVMHDWWIALVAASRGEIGLVQRPTMSYRQHGSNTLGAQSSGLAMGKKYLNKVISRKGCASLVSPLSIQAEALLRLHGVHLKPLDRIAVEAAARLREKGSLRRAWSALRHGFKKHGHLKQAVFLWALLYSDFEE
jgi:hypothetical protein